MEFSGAWRLHETWLWASSSETGRLGLGAPAPCAWTRSQEPRRRLMNRTDAALVGRLGVAAPQHKWGCAEACVGLGQAGGRGRRRRALPSQRRASGGREAQTGNSRGLHQRPLGRLVGRPRVEGVGVPSTPRASLLSPGPRGRAGGQAELGRRSPRPSWSVSICGGERRLLPRAGGPKGRRPVLRGSQAGQSHAREVGSM